MTYDDILELMCLRYQELAGFQPDSASDIGIRLKVLAGQLEKLYSRAEALEKEIFPQTSGGEYLELHAAQRGLSRKKAVAAKGVLRFTRTAAAQYDILIPAGTICATREDNPLRTETLEDGVLAAGELSVDIAAQSMEEGTSGNLAAGKICMMITPAQGISAVEQPEGFSGGIDAESDEELRQRLLSAYSVISNGTNSAFYYDLAMKREGVTSAAVLPRERGRGTVDVVIASDAHNPEEIADALGEELALAKEINVDVLVRTADIKTVNITVELDPEDGSDFDAVRELAEEEITGYLGQLPVGDMLRMAKLTSRVLSAAGVYNLKFTQPTGDVRAREDQILRPGTVTVERMEVT